jgi:hypothetical protein
VQRGLLRLLGQPSQHVRLGLRLRFGRPRLRVRRGPLLLRVHLRLVRATAARMNSATDVAAATCSSDVHLLCQLRQLRFNF